MTWMVCCDRCERVKDSPQQMPKGWRENDTNTLHYCDDCRQALETMRSPLATWLSPQLRAAVGWGRSEGAKKRRKARDLENRLVKGLAKAEGKHDALAVTP